jgi:hypothetical protein
MRLTGNKNENTPELNLFSYPVVMPHFTALPESTERASSLLNVE